ncbi:hypothetical protein QAD02_005284 [Eretmocerus hayati]|uniref:Uncharacterized protein n=1 Tax=Eretmocerus hayati TaxID=131215 RepID=A0ACC2NUW5_9HYME|nr:hypothetical protein QAD02_005284 [Eretmocerus hayati]
MSNRSNWMRRGNSSNESEFVNPQARFQQRQLQEKEQKLLQMYDQQQQRALQVAKRGSASSSSSNGSVHKISSTTVKSTSSFRRVGTGISSKYQNHQQIRHEDVNKSARVGNTATPQVIHGLYSEVREQQNYALARKTSRASDRDETDRVGTRAFVEVERQNYNGYSYENEINIDEVIDNDAMQRNRMLAKTENGHHNNVKRRPSTTIDESQQILVDPRDEHSIKDGSKTSLSRKSSLAASELSTRNAKNAATSKRSTLASTTGSSNGDLSRGGAASGEFKENNGVASKRTASFSSNKGSSGVHEQKDRSPDSKSGSLKFLSKIVGSNGEAPLSSTDHQIETVDPSHNRKLSSQALSDPPKTSHESLSRKKSTDGYHQHRHQQNQQRTGSPIATPAPRSSTTSSNSSANQQSSGSTLASSASRSHGSIGSRLAGKGGRGGAAPTPASRTSIVHEGSKKNDDSLSTCKTCNRRFNIDRITLHEQICSKTAQKKRKQFDAVIHRVKGTELEAFVQKPASKSKVQSKSVQKPEQPKPPTSNWRRKHEDFINAIRSAKQMQAHIAAGGKLSDLPPPPPSDTSDYVQCPHCSRKFNQGAAERHIPKCESMQHNKPKAQPRTIKR